MNVLTREALRSAAPSIFTRSAYHTLSGRYKVAPTADIIDALEETGLFPVRAKQSRCRLPDKHEYVKHSIRFRRHEHLNAELASEIPEVILTNSFDGTSAYGIDCGLHRVACLNGLTCPTTGLGNLRLRHSGGDDYIKRIIDATNAAVEHTPTILNTVSEWKGIFLPRTRQVEFAEAAWGLKPNDSIKPTQLLTSKRREDDTAEDGSRSLWVTLNCCQEWLTQGGLTGRNGRGRQIRTRPVKAVAADLLINRRLWQLAQAFSVN